MSLSITFSPPSGQAANGATISYDEAPQSPQEAMENNIFRSKRTFIVPWINRWQFAAVMLGYPTTIPATPLNGQNRYTISRLNPQGYAPIDLDPTGQTWLYATTLDSIQGEGRILSYDAQGVAQYKVARISIGYETLTYRIYSDVAMVLLGFTLPGDPTSPDEGSMVRYVTKYRQPTAEYLQLPYGSLKWVQPGPLVSVPGGTVGAIQAAQEISYTWHQVPSVPPGVKTQIGTVNSSPFDNGQYQRGQLLLTNVEVRPYRWFFNQRLFDIVYKFRFFAPQGGGLDVDPDTGFLTRDAGGNVLDEYYGNNHFLHFPQKPGQNNFDTPRYAMLSNDGLHPPFKNFDPMTLLPIGGTYPSPTSGRTVYTYSDFDNLFALGAPPSPPE